MPSRVHRYSYFHRVAVTGVAQATKTQACKSREQWGETVGSGNRVTGAPLKQRHTRPGE
ncbi:hypothetical protein C2S51_001302 [Perilla frutescens var. frutescens]|nr:hypothetical protein C2S51_001302 [Perilla frutescens var. frutescens]